MSFELAAGMSAVTRRQIVRDMGRISRQSYDDAKLDERILIADQTARMCYSGNTIPDNDDDKRTFIHLSNLEAVIPILTGLAKNEFLEMAKIYSDQKDKLIAAINDTDKRANKTTMSTTQGVRGSGTGRGTFV